MKHVCPFDIVGGTQGSVAQNTVCAMHQGHGGLSEVDNKGQRLASIGQVVGADGTVQQIFKEGVDDQEHNVAKTAKLSGEPLDNFGLGLSSL